MTARLTVSLEPRLTELPRLRERVSSFIRRRQMDRRAADRLRLVVEEIFVNVVRHGYAQGGTRRIGIELHADERELSLVVIDGGAPFDPTAKPAAEPVVDVASASVNGRGLLIVQALADTMHYERRPGRNELTVRLRVDEQEMRRQGASAKGWRSGVASPGQARADGRRAAASRARKAADSGAHAAAESRALEAAASRARDDDERAGASGVRAKSSHARKRPSAPEAGPQ